MSSSAATADRTSCRSPSRCADRTTTALPIRMSCEGIQVRGSQRSPSRSATTSARRSLLSDFLTGYGSTWGAFRSDTHPAIGNHEYKSSDTGAGYFAYFGDRSPDNYYSYDVGAWHLISLDSNCDIAGGCTSGSHSTNGSRRTSPRIPRCVRSPTGIIRAGRRGPPTTTRVRWNRSWNCCRPGRLAERRADRPLCAYGELWKPRIALSAYRRWSACCSSVSSDTG